MKTNTIRLMLLMPLFFLLLMAPLKSHSGGQYIKRFALVIGANDGGPDRVKLRYAVSDAKAVINILENMGGIMPDDCKLLIEPNKESVFWEMDRLKSKVGRLRGKFNRIEIIFYYSGHSDEANILLGKEKLPYTALRDQIYDVDADVRIAILDSCASGAFTRLKGGKKRSPFLLDSAYNMKGNAFMTSSSSDEASQESERLKGSFFTHNLITGMRGAADLRKDGRVTLSEAYHYAFNETLTQTEKTISGPQHPNYDIEMSGTGDVVMTEYRKNTALLKIGKAVSGRIFIHGNDNVLVVELSKPFGRALELGLEQGKYRIINVLEGEVFESHVVLKQGLEHELAEHQLVKTKRIDAVARGDLKPVHRKSVILKKRKMRFFGEVITKAIMSSSTGAVLMGGQVGFSFGHSFFVGFGGYGKINFNPVPGTPDYGGIILGYSFNPYKKYHLKVSALFGSGTGGTDIWSTSIFYIFEPEVKMVMNLSNSVRISAGIGIPITDKTVRDLKNPSVTFGFQFGK